MSLFDYKISQQLAADDVPFYALIMAAMRKADTRNLDLLAQAWPGVWDELQQRYNAPGGLIGDEALPIESLDDTREDEPLVERYDHNRSKLL